MQRITGAEPRETMARRINDAFSELEKRVHELEKELLEKSTTKKAKKVDESDKSE